MPLSLQRFLDAAIVRSGLHYLYLCPDLLLLRGRLDRSGASRWAGDAPVITDEHPWMEFFRNQGGNMTDRDTLSLLQLPQAGWDAVPGLRERPGLLQRVESENRALRQCVESVARGDQNLSVAAASLSRGTEFYLYRLGCATPQLEFLRRSLAPRPNGMPSRQSIEAHRVRCESLRAAALRD